MQKVKLSGADAEARMAPKPPPDPNRQLSRAGTRPRFYHNATDPHLPTSYDMNCVRLKSESLGDGISSSVNILISRSV